MRKKMFCKAFENADQFLGSKKKCRVGHTVLMVICFTSTHLATKLDNGMVHGDKDAR
jgi:hypothetical protein